MEIEEDLIDEDTVCGICMAEFLDVDDLQRHISQYHLSSRNLNNYCPFCVQGFPDLDNFALHMRNEHFSSILYCKYCTRFFIDEEVLTEHELKHRYSELNEKISCSSCESIFDGISQLESHEFAEHRFKDDSIMLQNAYPMLSSFLNMNFHLFIQALCENLLFDCTRCSFSTFDKTLFIQHLKTENEQCFACDVCCNVFKTKEILSNHCKTHITTINPRNVSVPNQCKRCKKILTGVNIKKHYKTCVDMKCNTCNLPFNSVTEYAKHAASHSAKKTVPLQICKYCQRPLVGVDVLEKHIERQHKHEIHLYKYHCKHCDKIFKHPKLLFGHFFSQHGIIKPYICNICNMSFRMRKSFTIHIKLEHKSVGFVEFDDQFYVHFTEKKSDKNKGNSNDDDCIINEEVTEMIGEGTKINGEGTKINGEGTKINGEGTKINGEGTKINGEGTKINEEETKVNEVDPKTNEVAEKKDDVNENRKIEATIEVTVEEVNEDNGQATEVDLNIDEVKKVDGNETESESSDIIYIEDTEKQEDSENEKEISRPKKRVTKKLKRVRVSDSDDSDALLSVIKKRTNKQKRKTRNGTNKFTCKQCNRNCYTFQNYHRHLALHKKNKVKTCIKCHKAFRHQSQLEKHIKKQHSSSKLTETLRKVMERKNNEHEIIDEDKVKGQSGHEKVDLIIAKSFRSTIKKKVDVETSATPVTITPVHNDKLSAKKFIENFMSENQDSRIAISSYLSIKRVTGERPPPAIKLRKFTPEPISTIQPKLRMPIKYKDEQTQLHDVSIKVVNKPLKSNFQLNSTTYEADFASNYEVPPGVAEEILLEDNSPESIIINDVLNTEDIKIGHLWPEAPPYFRIVEINEVDETPEMEDVEEPNLTLPDGTKLVNVNPLSHLLGARQLNDIRRAQYRNCYYNPKVKNVEQTLAKALMKLDKTKYQMKKEQRKKKVGKKLNENCMKETV